MTKINIWKRSVYDSTKENPQIALLKFQETTSNYYQHFDQWDMSMDSHCWDTYPGTQSCSQLDVKIWYPGSSFSIGRHGDTPKYNLL